MVRLDGLPKVHKQEFSPKTKCGDAWLPLFGLAKCLLALLNPLTQGSPMIVNTANAFPHKFDDVFVRSEEMVVYTNPTTPSRRHSKGAFHWNLWSGAQWFNGRTHVPLAQAVIKNMLHIWSHSLRINERNANRIANFWCKSGIGVAKTGTFGNAMLKANFLG